MTESKTLRILFIGNSHTYYNDMPLMVQRRATHAGYDCKVTMLAHPGWYLAQHAKEPDVRFNILYGKYDYVILQEYAHPFGPDEKLHDAVIALNEMICQAGSTPVLYECWARKGEPQDQAHRDEIHECVAKEINALLASVGKEWWDYMRNRPDLEMYAADGEHASPAGSDFAAKCIWETIQQNLLEKQD